MQNTLRRAAVTITLGPLVLFLIYLGGWFYFLAFSALLIIAILEYKNLSSLLGYSVPLWLIVPAAVAQWFAPPEVQVTLFTKEPADIDLVAIVLGIGVMAALGHALWLYERRPAVDAVGSWSATVTGIVLLGWLGAHFFRLRGVEPDGASWTALAMLSTWIADSAAYLFGKSIGRRKLSPRLSPNKTIEGYVGGIIVGTAATTGVAFYLELSILGAFILGLLISVFGPAGDLGISMLKRKAGVKDSGHFLPGHGGALDRTDSLLWAVVMAFYLLQFGV